MSHEGRPLPLVSAAWLAAHLGTVTVLDATVELPAPRFDGDYRVASGAAGWEAAHIPGARHADLVDALSIPHPLTSFRHPEADGLRASLADLGVTADRPTVVYDRSDGFWAARLWWMARAAGVPVMVLDGGWQAWQAIGAPVESGAAGVPARWPSSPPPAARSWPEAWVEREEVERIVAGASSDHLVCALSEAVFAGRQPTRYARRGAIPGSRNLPARDLKTPDGRLASPDTLDALFSARLGAEAGRRERLILYCGGGISAAYLALGLVVAGRDNVALYDNSLQEWSAVTHLPLICAPDAQ
ncbi:sulfurtransferase [Sphingomonas abietis]|uniref:Rhodanese-like domain-containing protein n=1 Tax=Sphingomonas abietis TaxID=3012344 RepID=A0ABY7NM54_9SPHN|nr:rhodanese-like domain-containing protein [Sphingomonas abietis]WBO21556.1 rhodanese-like domain-containing protein [Sphingomonas abietis]